MDTATKFHTADSQPACILYINLAHFSRFGKNADCLQVPCFCLHYLYHRCKIPSSVCSHTLDGKIFPRGLKSGVRLGVLSHIDLRSQPLA